MFGIHPIHRRLAEISFKVIGVDGKYSDLDPDLLRDLQHCLVRNLDIIRKLDELKSLSFVAYELGDAEWVHKLSAEIDVLEDQFA